MEDGLGCVRVPVETHRIPALLRVVVLKREEHVPEGLLAAI